MASPYHRILVGWDGSPAARAALNTAATIADGGGIVIAHAVLRPATHTETTTDQDQDLHSQRAWLQTEFDQAHQAAAEHGSQIRLEWGNSADIAEDICTAAAHHGCDLLVIGRHGSDSHMRTTDLGPVAYAITRSSNLPVLLLSPEAA